jgi:DNA replication protein DnaC
MAALVVLGSCAAQTLTLSLNTGRATGAYGRQLVTLSRVVQLVIDDFGLKPLRAPADDDMHDLIAERCERAATIVPSNMDFDECGQAFATNRLLDSAALGRLRHRACCLGLDGPSYRDPKVSPAEKT